MGNIKWRVPVESYVIIEAETPDEARREVEARREGMQDDDKYLISAIEYDLLLNATIGTVVADDSEPWAEHN